MPWWVAVHGPDDLQAMQTPVSEPQLRVTKNPGCTLEYDKGTSNSHSNSAELGNCHSPMLHLRKLMYVINFLETAKHSEGPLLLVSA